jgi:hypothetical protein
MCYRVWFLLMEDNMDTNTTRAWFFTNVGRLFAVLAFLALLCAWLTQLTGGPLFGMSQQHLFNDTMALALLSIVCLLDALLHAKNL